MKVNEYMLEGVEFTMYTVKEVSEILEVSRQTIYVYLKDLSSELREHTFKIKGATHIDEEGIRIIKIALGLIQVPTVEEKEISIDDIVNEIKNSLMQELKAETLELKESNQLESKQVKEELKAESLKLQEKHKEDLQEVKLELNQEIQELKKQNEKLIEMMEESQNRKGFISRLFKR